jgi:DNA-binding CsgD family transcriptional regulator
MVTGTPAAGRPTLADLAEQFRRLPVDAGAALSEIAVPAFILSRDGKIVWLNVAAIDLIGDRRGDHYSKVVAPESRRAVGEQFTKKVVGGATSTSYMAVLLLRDGTRRVADLDSVRLDDGGRMIGVFGLVEIGSEPEHAGASSALLTPRQHQVLAMLASGCSTNQIAEQLSITLDTVRNHVRGVLRALDAHSRLEAVAQARARGII